MTDTTGKTPHTIADEIPESTADPDLDLILEHWISIAALAWCGWYVWGTGAVFFVVTSDSMEVTYEPGSPCPCHPIRATTYDPREQVVIVICREGGG